MTNPFIPIHPRNSFNRVRIVDLPGITPEPHIHGKIAYELVSQAALTTLVQQQADTLGLNAYDPQLLKMFNQCFHANDTSSRDTAEAIARQFGRNLGWVLLTLKRGDAVNQAARPDWQPEHWAYWRRNTQIILGGGLVAGEVGTRIPQYAMSLLADHGITDISITLAPHGKILPLLGMTRCAAPRDGQVLVFDFGHTFVKRAIATSQDGQITTLRQLHSMPAPCSHIPGDQARHAHGLENAMAHIVHQTWVEVNRVEAFGISIAAYVNNGQIVEADKGCYVPLMALGDDIQIPLANTIAALRGVHAPILVEHDGTAAATTYAGEDAIILMVGTAVGVGFPPANSNLTPIAKDFRVIRN